jgi:hypothetical protein
MMRWAKHVECMRAVRNAYKILDKKPEGKRPLGRSRHRQEDNLNKVRRYGLDLSGLG